MTKFKAEQTNVPKRSVDRESIHKVLNYLGLTLLEIELDELEAGNCVRLGGRNLSDLGSLFIIVSALLTKNLGKSNKPSITFHDLPQVNADSNYLVGVPIYSWTDTVARHSLFFSFS